MSYSFEYQYRAIPRKIYDGDTITEIDIDLGFQLKIVKEKIRLVGINTPELRGGTESTRLLGTFAKHRLIDLILNKPITLKTVKDKRGKFGRYLGIIFLEDGTNVNDLLINESLAIPYGGEMTESWVEASLARLNSNDKINKL